MSKKNEKGSLPPGQWTAIRWQMLDSAAWKETSFGARALYVALARTLSNTRFNNGQLFLSSRDAAEELGADQKMVCIWYRELEHYGFIVKTSPAYLGVEGRGRAAKYRITDMPWGADATKEYTHWSGEIFEPKPRGEKHLRVRRKSPHAGEVKNTSGPPASEVKNTSCDDPPPEVEITSYLDSAIYSTANVGPDLAEVTHG